MFGKDTFISIPGIVTVSGVIGVPGKIFQVNLLTSK